MEPSPVVPHLTISPAADLEAQRKQEDLEHGDTHRPLRKGSASFDHTQLEEQALTRNIGNAFPKAPFASEPVQQSTS